MGEAAERLMKSPRWRHFARGDRVAVKGRSGEWVFQAHCRNEKTGDEWLEIFGGPRGYMAAVPVEAEVVDIDAPFADGTWGRRR